MVKNFENFQIRYFLLKTLYLGFLTVKIVIPNPENPKMSVFSKKIKFSKIFDFLTIRGDQGKHQNF